MLEPESTEDREAHVSPSRRKILGSLLTAGVVVTAASAAANTLEPTSTPSAGTGRFVDRTVLITGATSGIGRATAEVFAREGARVMFCGRRDTLGVEVEAAIRAAGGEATFRRADVRNPAEVEALIAACVATYGSLDILYNNAGIFMTPVEIQDITVENYQDIMSTNSGGVFFGMKYAIPIMRQQGRGAIVNMASVAGHKGFANTAAYNASKHAIIGMTKAAAVANARHNIRVNSLSPLAVDTPQLRESFDFQGITYEAAAPNFVTPRIMQPYEIANAVMFLASDEATSITGMDLDVTGGQLA